MKCVSPRFGRSSNDQDGGIAIDHGAGHDCVRHPVLTQRLLWEPFVPLRVVKINIPEKLLLKNSHFYMEINLLEKVCDFK